jgi:two-component system sensor histidine kinase BarA
MGNAGEEKIQEFAKLCHIQHFLSKPFSQQKLYKTLIQSLAIKGPTEDQAKLSPIASPSLQHIKVLAVDDNLANLKLLQVMLSEIGVTVFTATSGQQAIDIAASKPIDLILMDIQMPEMSGIEAMKSIRQLKLNKLIPIIAVTADVMEDQKEILLAEGMDDYQTKPISEEKLRAIIQKWAIKEEPLIDMELGKKLAGGKEGLAFDMLTMLLASLPDELTIMTEAYEKKDWQALQAYAHKLHGATCYCGVPALKSKVKALEIVLKQQNYQEIDRLFAEFKQCAIETQKAV